MGTRTAALAGGGTVLGAGTALALLFLGGGSPTAGYAPGLRYLPRTDLLVIAPPKTPPVGRPGGGKLDEYIAGLAGQGGITLDPATADPVKRKQLDDALEELFGTPAAPAVPGGEPLGLTAESLAAGSVLFKDKCVACHGMTGDGRGPTSLWVFPPARDVRRGQFKFVSAAGGTGTPTRDDLARLIRKGIDGNSMPPFDQLAEEQVRDVVAYTIHLSVRGQVEFDALAALLGDDGLDDPAGFCRSRLTAVLARWTAAAPLTPTSRPDVEPRPADTDAAHDDRVRRGWAVFAGAGACLSCHQDYGRKSHDLYDLWGVPVSPANLVEGRYKAGGDPLELYRRVACGIGPSGMPAASQLSESQTWDVVAFVKALPVPRHLPADVRKRVYPQAE